MQSPLASLFDLYILTPGRRLYSLAQIRERAQAQQLDPLVALIDQALAHDKHVLDLDAARRGGGSDEPVRDKDLSVDRILSTVDALLSHYVAAEDPTALALQPELFPQGLAAHTRLPFIEQKAANERVLSILRGPERQAWLAERGVTALAKQLEQAHARFSDALEARDQSSAPSWAELKAASDAGQEAYLEVVVEIIALTRDDAELRAELLTPVMTQERQVADQRRTRRSPGEIDPSTGELLEEDEAAEPEQPPLLEGEADEAS